MQEKLSKYVTAFDYIIKNHKIFKFLEQKHKTGIKYTKIIKLSFEKILELVFHFYLCYMDYTSPGKFTMLCLMIFNPTLLFSVNFV